jgi:membrane protein required for colicin V production
MDGQVQLRCPRGAKVVRTFSPPSPRTTTFPFAAVNWLDWLLLLLFALAAFQGFRRGFIIEVCSLLALLLGIWAAVQFSERVGAAVGLSPDRTAIAFLITFVAVLIGVHLLGRALTKLVDMAMLGIPNKLAGIAFGVVRSAFTLSIVLNLLVGWSDGRMPSPEVRNASSLHGPVRAFAPFIIPALGETKWVKEVVEQLKQEALELWEGQP